MRIISAERGECLMPLTGAPIVVVTDPESRHVFAGDGSPGNNDGLAAKCRLFQSSAQNSTTWYMFATPKQAVSRYSQR